MYSRTFVILAVLAAASPAAGVAQVPPIPPIPPIPAIPPIPSVRIPSMVDLDVVLRQADMALRTARPSLMMLGPSLRVRMLMTEPALIQARAALQAMPATMVQVGPMMVQAQAALVQASAAMAHVEHGPWQFGYQHGGSNYGSEAPEPWIQGDPADSLYQAARGALNRGENTTAAALFARIRERFPRSGYVADSYYWQAFALRRSDDTESLRTALKALDEQKARFPRATTRADADVVTQQVLGALARRGDADAAARLEKAAVPPPPTSPPTASTALPPVRSTGRGSSQASQGCPRDGDDDDVRIAVLDALMQMNSANAVPILRDVLNKRDECSVVLRRKAVFILSQKRSAETEDILLNSARNDPDREVREEAVQWLHQVGTERSVAALDSIMMGSNDPELQKKAIFSLSQSRSPKAGEALRRLIERSDVSTEVREEAIQWLGHNRRHPDNATFLREFYKKAENAKLKEKVVFALSQIGGPENGRFMLDIAVDESESTENRKQALFWAGQTRSIDIAAFVGLYDRMQNRELKKHLVFVYSQRREAAAVDKLMDIARNEQDRELRREAIQWLGQSRDPRVVAFLVELINR